MKQHILFSKRMLVILIAGILGIILCACEQGKGELFAESPTPGSPANLSASASGANASPALSEVSSEATAPLDAASLDAYKAVLQNSVKFFNTDENEYMDINQFIDSFYSTTGATVKILKFAVVDLDSDGTPEVILWEQRNNDDYYGFEVLRYHSEVVYGYGLPYRGFMQLKADRTFTFSGGAMDSGFGTIKFSDETYSIDKITYSQSSYDSNNNLTVSFFINNKSTTQDEFESAINEQDEKPDVIWYDFTDDNIETVFTDA